MKPLIIVEIREITENHIYLCYHGKVYKIYIIQMMFTEEFFLFFGDEYFDST